MYIMDDTARLEKIPTGIFNRHCQVIRCRDIQKDIQPHQEFVKMFIKTYTPMKWQDLTVNQIYNIVNIEYVAIGLDEVFVFRLNNEERVWAPDELAEYFNEKKYDYPKYFRSKGNNAFDVLN